MNEFGSIHFLKLIRIHTSYNRKCGDLHRMFSGIDWSLTEAEEDSARQGKSHSWPLLNRFDVLLGFEVFQFGKPTSRLMETWTVKIGHLRATLLATSNTLYCDLNVSSLLSSLPSKKRNHVDVVVALFKSPITTNLNEISNLSIFTPSNKYAGFPNQFPKTKSSGLPKQVIDQTNKQARPNRFFQSYWPPGP